MHAFHPSFITCTQMMYNDASPMENHHCSAAFGVLHSNGNNFLGHLPREVRIMKSEMKLDNVMQNEASNYFYSLTNHVTSLGFGQDSRPHGYGLDGFNCAC